MTSYDDFDETHHPRPVPSQFSQLIEKAVSRRHFLKSGMALGIAPFITSTGCSTEPTTNFAPPSKLAFSAIGSNTLDTISLPDGYQWEKLISWGDPLTRAGNPFNGAKNFSKADQALAFGDNNDGMQFFPIDDHRALLVVNNEYISRWSYYTTPDNATAEDVLKAQLGHGVSVLELKKHSGQWQLNLDGEHARRITAQSPMGFSGPAAGHELLKTSDAPLGMQSLGTWANCGCGKTPWGTYLSCEENFNAYFGSTDTGLTPNSAQKRYGLSAKDWGLQWYKHQDRFDLKKEPHEANRMGWVIEFDPYDPQSTPIKHTALGRFKHENAEWAIAESGQVVVYMGDDERGEHLYRFVSDGVYVEGQRAANMKLLGKGRLYAAKFDAADDDLQGKGRWLELALGSNNIGPDTGFNDQATICVHARLAASAAGATTMDRPEWVASHPYKVEVYCALTNNKYRGIRPNAGDQETPVGGPNPREANLYGQIVRWRPSHGDHLADTFDWDLFALAGNPTIHTSGLAAGSDNLNADNMFNSPDGLAFDQQGLLWIQTDGNFSNQGEYAGMGNNQMLAADPESGEIRRFMVGPRGCEITGLCWSDDGESMFVGVQHPGDHNSGSDFPDGDGKQPRSTVVVVRRDQKGPIGA